MSGRGDGSLNVARREEVLLQQEVVKRRWEAVKLTEEWYARPARDRRRRVLG